LHQQIEEKNNIILTSTNIINKLEQNIADKNLLINNQNDVIKNMIQNGTACQRIKNHLAYKLGTCAINTNKVKLILLPLKILIIYLNHILENKNYIKQPKLYEYNDYIDASKLKQTYTYKLGELLIQSFSNWYKLSIFTLPLKIKQLKQDFKPKQVRKE
ncbi:hypothetical protein KJR01_09400, partial [Campylobacter sp. 2018MI10]|nr:hypothetical protein [Campylobacter sp. 2018MI10]